MKRVASIVCATVLTILLFHDTCPAGGWGPYFSWGREEPSAGFPDDVVDTLRDFLPPEVIEQVEANDVDFSLNHIALGVIYDTAPARDGLFSYRGTLGFDIATSISIDEVTIGPFSSTDFGLDLDETSRYGLLPAVRWSTSAPIIRSINSLLSSNVATCS